MRLDRPALRAGVRAALAVSVGFVLGRYVLDDDQFAVFAGFTAMALLAFADYGGPIRWRLAANVATVAVALPLVGLGTAVSLSAWGAPLAVGAAALVVAYCVVLGGYFVAGANAVILFVVLAAGIPAPDDAIGARLAGTAVGGALAAAASVLLWPARPERDARRTLGAAAAALRACLAEGDPGAPLAAARRQVGGVRAGLGDWSHRASEPTAAHRALLRIVHDLDRLLDRIAALPRAPGERTAAARTLLDSARDGLSAAAEALAGRRPARDPAQLHGLLQQRILRVRGDLAAAAPREPEAFAREVDAAAVAGEVAQAATLIALDAEVASGRRPRAADPALAELLDAGPIEIAGRRLRDNLSLRSVHLRNALRVATGLALAMALVQALELQHGFWVVLATLTVLRTTAATTGVTVEQALLGTAIGFVASLIVIFAAGADSHLYAALLAVVVLGAVYASRAGGIVGGQAGFTVLVVVLFSLLAPSRWTLALVRVEDVVAGALVGLVIGLLVWPRGAAGMLPGAIADVVERGLDEARAAVRGALGRDAGARVGALHAESLRAMRRVEDALAVALSERRPAGASLAAWVPLVAEAGRLRYSTAWLERVPISAPTPPRCRRLADDLIARTDAAAAGYAAAAAALRADGAGAATGPAVPAAPGDAKPLGACLGAIDDGAGADGRPIVRLLVVRHWVRELEARLARLPDAGPARSGAGGRRLDAQARRRVLG